MRGITQRKVLLYTLFVLVCAAGCNRGETGSETAETAPGTGSSEEMPREGDDGTAPDEEPAPQGPASFSWGYESSAEGEYPKTRILLTATYADGTVETRPVDTVTGGCNAIPPDRGEAIAEGSEKIQCYYAGLGHRYRILEQDGAYAVEKETFEEATPDYDPPEPEFETIATFDVR
jgi:hypothetical protein